MNLPFSRRTRRTAAGVSVVAVVAVGIVAYTASGASANYRIATVALGDVSQSLNLTGTVSLTGRSDLQFGTAGTVTTVLSVGTAVHQGDVVAQLDTTQLSRSLVIAQADVTRAQTQLSTDEAALNAPTPAATAPPSRGNGADAAVAAAQKACLSGDTPAGPSRPQETGSASPSPSASASGSSTSTPSASPSTPPGRGGTGGSDSSAACAAALNQVKQAVRQALTSANGAATGSSRSAQGAPVTEATISRDQASVAQARTKVIQAQQQLAGAVLTAPVDGTVAAVDVTAGSAASIGTTALTVIGKGLTTVSINATVAHVAKLTVGQAATITSTLGQKVGTGKVTWIGQLPDSSTSTFPVVVTLDAKSTTLAAGAPVDVAVVLGSAQGVITVPTSAVRNGTVTVVEAGKTSSTRVSVGLVGPDRTQITEGLTPGQTVALADLAEALPTSTVNQGRFGAGFGGGGVGGAGLGGTRRTFGG